VLINLLKRGLDDLKISHFDTFILQQMRI